MRTFSCVCSEVLEVPDSNASDVKCPMCGRVYTHNGRFLWRESPGNSLPGSSEIIGAPIVTSDEDMRAEDQDGALEQAFAKGTLPEEDRRASEPVLTEAPATPPAEPVQTRGSSKRKS